MVRNLTALILATVLCLAGCAPSGGARGTGTTPASGTAAVFATSVPHYEEKVRLSAGMNEILDMRLTEEDGLLVAATDARRSHVAVFAQADDGTWEEAFDADGLMESLGENRYLSRAALTPQGTLLCIASSSGGTSPACYAVDRDGSFSRSSLPIGSDVFKFRVDDDGSVIVSQSGSITRTKGGLVRYDAAGGEAVEYELAEGEFAFDFAVHEETLYVVVTRSNSMQMESDIVAFEARTGAMVDVDPSLRAAFDQVLPAPNGFDPGASPVLASGSDALYVCSKGAVFRCADGAAERVLDGAGTHLENSTEQPADLLLLPDGSLAIQYQDRMSSEGAVYRYFEGEREQTAELTVYALEDNADVQQAVVAFRDDHPETAVELQVGIPAGSGLTADDAIRALNADLLAGTGPDVLVLDGLPMKDLVEQGMLLDLEDDVQAARSRESYYENVLTAFSSDDGCFAVPTRFALPAAVGDEDVLGHAGSLEELAAYVDRSDETRAQLGSLSLAALYTASYPVIVDEDGSVDADALAAFFRSVQRLVEITESNRGEGVDPSYDYIGALFRNFDGDAYGLDIGAMGLLDGDDRIAVGSLVDTTDYGMAGIAVANADYPCAIVPLAFDGVRTFEPRTVVGVSADSQNADAARDLVAFMLGKTQQAGGRSLGLPVCKSVFEEAAQALGGYSMGSMSAEGGMTNYERGALADDEIAAYHRMVESATAASVPDKVVTDVIAAELEACCRGTVSPDDAVGNALQKLKLYQAQ